MTSKSSRSKDTHRAPDYSPRMRCSFGHDYLYHSDDKCNSCSNLKNAIMPKNAKIPTHLNQLISTKVGSTTHSYHRHANDPRKTVSSQTPSSNQNSPSTSSTKQLHFPHLPFFRVQKVSQLRCCFMRSF